MSMSKKDFIALADYLNTMGLVGENRFVSVADLHTTLADFCQSQNPNFKRGRWLGYIRGENAPNGGSVKGGKV